MKKTVSIILLVLSLTFVLGALASCSEDNEFKVNFIVDGEVYSFVNTDGQKAVTMPKDPQKEGYTFDGWYWDKDVWEKPFTSDSLVNASASEDVAVYAKFSEIVSEGLKFTSNGDGTCYVSRIGTCTDAIMSIPKESPAGDTVTGIDDGAFARCDGFTYIKIPNSVTSIGYSAFFGCTGLTSIIIPDSVTSIGNDAFYECTGLTSITVETGNTKYHSVGNCLIETSNKTLIVGCKNSIIPNDGSVTSIGSYAFCGCTGLTSVTIPDCVTSIGSYAFYGCTGLTSITVETGNTKYHSVGNCLIETSNKTLIVGCKNSIIPNDGSVTRIGDGAFSGCTGLTSIIIPDSVTRIGSHAFYRCTGLTSVTIPDSVTSIGELAFSICTSLTSVTYNGTKAQWNAISKGGCWKDFAPFTSVTCTDGTVSV